MSELIHEMLRAFREAGVAVDDAAALAVEQRIRELLGGERVYIPSLPKQNRAVQLAKLERHTQVQAARVTGLSVRQVRRILRGK